MSLQARRTPKAITCGALYATVVVREIPGFGRNLNERLINWRQGLQCKFHFEATVVTDPLDVQRIDRELAARRTRYMISLR